MRCIAAAVLCVLGASPAFALDQSWVGQTKYSSAGSIELCQAPFMVLHCPRRPTDAIQIKGIFDPSPLNGWSFYKVELSDGTVGYVPQTEAIFLKDDPPEVIAANEKAKKDSAAKECARRGSPKIGMTGPEVVATCWGQPQRASRITGTAGTIDIYLYSKGRSVTLHNGVVTTIAEGL